MQCLDSTLVSAVEEQGSPLPNNDDAYRTFEKALLKKLKETILELAAEADHLESEPQTADGAAPGTPEPHTVSGERQQQQPAAAADNVGGDVSPPGSPVDAALQSEILAEEYWKPPEQADRQEAEVFRAELDFVKFPFDDMGAWEHFRENLRKRIRFTPAMEILNRFPPELEDLLGHIFEADPTVRFTAEQVLHSEWMQPPRGANAEGKSRAEEEERRVTLGLQQRVSNNKEMARRSGRAEKQHKTDVSIGFPIAPGEEGNDQIFGLLKLVANVMKSDLNELPDPDEAGTEESHDDFSTSTSSLTTRSLRGGRMRRNLSLTPSSAGSTPGSDHPNDERSERSDTFGGRRGGLLRRSRSEEIPTTKPPTLGARSLTTSVADSVIPTVHIRRDDRPITRRPHKQREKRKHGDESDDGSSSSSSSREDELDGSVQAPKMSKLAHGTADGGEIAESHRVHQRDADDDANRDSDSDDSSENEFLARELAVANSKQGSQRSGGALQIAATTTSDAESADGNSTNGPVPKAQAADQNVKSADRDSESSDDDFMTANMNQPNGFVGGTLFVAPKPTTGPEATSTSANIDDDSDSDDSLLREYENSNRGSSSGPQTLIIPAVGSTNTTTADVDASSDESDDDFILGSSSGSSTMPKGFLHIPATTPTTTSATALQSGSQPRQTVRKSPPPLGFSTLPTWHEDGNDEDGDGDGDGEIEQEQKPRHLWYDIEEIIVGGGTWKLPFVATLFVDVDNSIIHAFWSKGFDSSKWIRLKALLQEVFVGDYVYRFKKSAVVAMDCIRMLTLSGLAPQQQNHGILHTMAALCHFFVLADFLMKHHFDFEGTSEDQSKHTKHQGHRQTPIRDEIQALLSMFGDSKK